MDSKASGEEGHGRDGQGGIFLVGEGLSPVKVSQIMGFLVVLARLTLASPELVDAIYPDTSATNAVGVRKMG